VFWAYDGASGIGTPPLLYNQVVDAIVSTLEWSGDTAKVDSGFKLLKLYGAVAGAMADACIYGWYEKYKWNYWRPVVGIRYTPGVYGTEADPDWRPYGVPLTDSAPKGENIPPEQITSSGQTPMFPSYPSGHAIMGTAALHALMQTIDVSEDFTFSFVSDELNGETKDQSGLTRPLLPRTFTIKEAIQENAASRVYLGVHWGIDVEAGIKQGALIGDQVGSSFPHKL
jgi:vanadium chloroperoxidase